MESEIAVQLHIRLHRRVPYMRYVGINMFITVDINSIICSNVFVCVCIYCPNI